MLTRTDAATLGQTLIANGLLLSSIRCLDGEPALPSGLVEAPKARKLRFTEIKLAWTIHREGRVVSGKRSCHWIGAGLGTAIVTAVAWFLVNTFWTVNGVGVLQRLGWPLSNIYLCSAAGAVSGHPW
jgi:hypothetical protein